MIPGLQVVKWLEDEPDGPRRRAVERWLMVLAAGELLGAPQGLPGNDSAVVVEIPDAGVIAVCVPIPVLDVIVIERIGSTETT